MPDVGDRLSGKDASPSEEAVRKWLGREGHAQWRALTHWIETSYPGTFAPDWVFGGAKHGWSLRYKKSKSFCTLIPEYGRLAVVIVFGKDERDKVERILPELPPAVAGLYEAAQTYHDGKWLKLAVPAEANVADVARLLTIKRRPKPSSEGNASK